MGTVNSGPIDGAGEGVAPTGKERVGNYPARNHISYTQLLPVKLYVYIYMQLPVSPATTSKYQASKGVMGIALLN